MLHVFVSWAGVRSAALADSLSSWLGWAIRHVTVLVSEDAAVGARGNIPARDDFWKAKCGILCVTRENAHSSWLQFEAGAIAVVAGVTRVVTMTLDDGVKVVPPLAQFPRIAADEHGARQLLDRVNRMLPASKQLSQRQLGDAFDRTWPSLSSMIADARSIDDRSSQKMSQRELVVELLDSVARIEALVKRRPVAVLVERGGLADENSRDVSP